jgi:hypothetical protein
MNTQDYIRLEGRDGTIHLIRKGEIRVISKYTSNVLGVHIGFTYELIILDNNKNYIALGIKGSDFD